eukprot:jgi/Picsp_1/2242/NSC_05706-R1_mitochondrial folate transporter carrier-like
MPLHRPVKQSDKAIAGVVAGATTVALLHPLDVIKTRLQVQDGVLPVYRGMLDTMTKIWHSSGFRGLYAGLVPSMLGSGAAWGTYFYIYGVARHRRSQKRNINPIDNLLSATEAGIVVSVATNPIWVVKTRLQLQDRYEPLQTHGGPRVYRGSLDCLSRIVKEEGISGLYRGLLPSLILVSHGAIQLAVYEKLKSMFRSVQRQGKVDPLEQGNLEDRRPSLSISSAGICGALSKATATLATYPTQVVRSRLQQRMDTRKLKYAGFVNTVRVILRREGLSGFYKGVFPNLLRVMPQSAVTFLVYEATLRILSRE